MRPNTAPQCAYVNVGGVPDRECGTYAEIAGFSVIVFLRGE